MLLWVAAEEAAGHGLRSATCEELGFLRADGVHAAFATHGLLLSVDVAIGTCGLAGTEPSLLEVMAGIPELRPYTAPPTHAQPLAAQSLGVP